MKVLMIGNSPRVNGGITSVINQIKGYKWEDKGIFLKFISTYDGGDRVKKIFYFFLASVRIFFYLVLEKPDVVYMHMSHHGSFDRKNIIQNICQLFKVKTVVHLHGSEFKKWYEENSEQKKKVIMRFLQRSSLFIVLGEVWREIIKEIEPRTNIVVLPNSIHVPKYQVAWNENVINYIFLGVLVERKGVKDLIEAANLLLKEGKIDNKRFIIVGDGEEREALEMLVNQYSLKNYFEFKGWATGEVKERTLMNSQVMILPSYNEGLPIAILEAISIGMPVIATNVGDISSAVIDDYNGTLIEINSPVLLAEAIEKYNNKKEFMLASDNSKRLAEEKFSDVNYFEQLKKILQFESESAEVKS